MNRAWMLFFFVLFIRDALSTQHLSRQLNKNKKSD